MPKPAPDPIAAYIAARPEPVRAILEQLRATLRRALPESEEVIAYGMPTFKQDGRAVVSFAGWKAHVSLYYASRRVIAALGGELTPYRAEKDTIRFELDQPLPLHLVARIAKVRAEEVGEYARVKALVKALAKEKEAGAKVAKAKPGAKKWK